MPYTRRLNLLGWILSHATADTCTDTVADAFKDGLRDEQMVNMVTVYRTLRWRCSDAFPHHPPPTSWYWCELSSGEGHAQLQHTALSC